MNISDLRERTGESVILYRYVTASEVASVLSDADLLGELVRRGVLKEETSGELIRQQHRRFISAWKRSE